MSSDANVARRFARDEGYPQSGENPGGYVYVVRSLESDVDLNRTNYELFPEQREFLRYNKIQLEDIYGRRRVDETGRFVGPFEVNPYFKPFGK